MHYIYLDLVSTKEDQIILSQSANQRDASVSVAKILALSNPADAQNVSYLGLCGIIICPKCYA